MVTCESRVQELMAEIERLRSRLDEAGSALKTSRNGEVDPINASRPAGDQVDAVSGADGAYRVLFETMNEGAAILGPDGTVYSCNAALSNVFRIPAQQLLGRSILDLVAPEYSEAFKTLLDKSSKAPQKIQLAVRPSNRAIVHACVSTSPVLIEGVSAICMIVTDITESGQAQEAPRANDESLLESLLAVLEGSQDTIYIKDIERRFTRVNPAGAAFFGQPPEKLLGKRQEDFGGSGAEIKHFRELDLRTLSGQSIEEQRALFCDGAKSVWKIIQRPLYDKSGVVVGLCGIARNITDWQRHGGEAPSLVEGASYTSEAMRSTLYMAKKAAERDIIVLLLGVSGSGKDYVAKYIHEHSPRADGPYFSINCAAIASTLAESELFGHEKGAFTGALTRKKGLLELAEGGTLLLNEIGDLSPPLQSKLLTFLDTKKFTRVGGEREIVVDVRLIAATNKDLNEEIETGRFRSDLFYRLNAITIKIPPLRERVDDIPGLVQQFLHRLHSESQIHYIPSLSPEAMNALKKYPWPGNVRELRNVIERAVMLSQGEELNVRDLGFDGHRERTSSSDAKESPSFEISFPVEQSLEEITHAVKRFLISEALKRSNGSRQGAAELLGISRFALRRYMKTLRCEDDK